MSFEPPPSLENCAREIATVFIRLGMLGFGGPIATMAMMEEEAVRKRGWMTPAQFSEIYAVCKVLPGPVSTQMAIYLGMTRAGHRWGGLLSGGLFILPSFVMVLGLSILYKNTGIVSRVGSFLLGLQAAALAVIVLSTWMLSKPFRRIPSAWAIAAASTGLVFVLPSWEPLVILGFGFFGVMLSRKAGTESKKVLEPTRSTDSKSISKPASKRWLLGVFAIVPVLFLLPVLRGDEGRLIWSLFWMCFKAGAFVFGTGLAIVPVLEAESVAVQGWLTHSQFMDGLALGQVTPGPVVITSTFIGYIAAGFLGAIATTFGIFLPAFVNVLFLVPRVWKRFSGTRAASGFTAYAIPAVVGGILGTTLKLASVTLASGLAVALFAVALGVAIWRKPPAWLLIPSIGLLGGMAGWVIGLFR